MSCCETHAPWLSRSELAERISAELIDVTPRSIERIPIPSRLVLGKRRYCYSCAAALFKGLLEQSETVVGTPGAAPLKAFEQ